MLEVHSTDQKVDNWHELTTTRINETSPKKFFNLPVKGKLSAKESLASSSGMTSKKYRRGISKSRQQHSTRRPVIIENVN
jgi:hypothetical protein